MSKALIKQFIERNTSESGMIETPIQGVQLFRITDPIRCAPAVYEPSVTAILSGSKEAIWDGKRKVYDCCQYICCTTPMPLEAGTPHSSADDPLLGVYISFDTKVMVELALEVENSIGVMPQFKERSMSNGLLCADWDDDFTNALLRLLMLAENPADISILGYGRLRELYYAILKGKAGHSVRRAFGTGNEIARSIEFLSSHLNETVAIEDIAQHIGMSRAVFHRKFKQATNMSPIQFLKAMRLNNAAMKIAKGMNVNVAAMAVGYTSSSQFSREFKRMYGQSPKQWSQLYGIDDMSIDVGL